VSQRLDCADELVVLDHGQDRSWRRRSISLSEWQEHGRLARLEALQVDRLVCGGVSNFDKAGWENSGVGLLLNVAGPIEPVVTAVFAGVIAPGQSYWDRLHTGNRLPQAEHRSTGPTQEVS